MEAIQRDMANTGLSLDNALLTLADAQYASAKVGGPIQATSANGQSVRFDSSGKLGYSQRDVTEMIYQLRRRYRAAVASLDDSSTDALIITEILLRLTPITSYRTRYRNLRYLNP